MTAIATGNTVIVITMMTIISIVSVILTITFIINTIPIIVTSSWIKSLPTLYFINKVVESLQLIEGLSPLAPLYIAIAGLRLKGLNHQEIEERLEQLDRYVKLLYHMYDLPNSTNIHIIESQKYLHISGNVQKMLYLIKDYHLSVKYLYYLKHDFSFGTGVNHKALIEVVQENKNINLV